MVSLFMVGDSSDSSWWFHFLYPTLFGTMISDDFLIQMSWQFGRSFLDQLCQAPWMLDWVTELRQQAHILYYTHIICIQKFVNAYIHACIYTCIYIGMIYSEYMYQCVCNCIHICFWKMKSCHSPNPHGKLVCCLRLCHLPLVQRGAATRTCVKMPRAQTKNSKWYIHFCKARTCDVPYWKRAFLSISSLLTVNFRFRLQETFRDVRIIKQWIMKYVQIIQTPKLHYASKRLT